jgi:NMD protein affecting ribosome stability and mRNA decay
MRRGTPVCVDCGGPKRPGSHHMVQRCDACDKPFKAAMLACNKALNQARSRGLFPSPKTLICVDCGASAHDYDHRDYSKPLEVEPVCRACNFKRGPALYPRAYHAAPDAKAAA